MPTTAIDRHRAVRDYQRDAAPLLRDWGAGARTVDALREIVEFDAGDAGDDARAYVRHVIGLADRWHAGDLGDEPLQSEAWPGANLAAIVNAKSGRADWRE